MPVVSLIASTASDGRVGSGCHQTCLRQTNGSWNNSVELQCRRGYLQPYHTKTVRITDLNLHVVHSIRNQVAIMQEVYRSVRQRQQYLQPYHTKTVRITDLNLHVVHSIRNQVAIMQEVYRSVRQRQQYQTVHAPPPLK